MIVKSKCIHKINLLGKTLRVSVYNMVANRHVIMSFFSQLSRRFVDRNKMSFFIDAYNDDFVYKLKTNSSAAGAARAPVCTYSVRIRACNTRSVQRMGSN